ncbi:nicotinate ribosyltransferase [Microbacterium phage PauloDiaboli]|nr:nicotinate ribosyltransferase [Microbacterium phage PauloDiaboli]
MSKKFPAIRALIDTDAYKLGHIHMYPEGTEYVLSNFTDRGSRIEGVEETVHFGLQAFLHSWLTDEWEPFFAATEDEVAEQYEEFTASVLNPEVGGRVGVEHIRALHRLGYLPLEFKSLPEGAKVPLRVPKFTVQNTHPEFFWLTNYIETPMSAEVWQIATSATIADRFRTLLDEWAIKTTGSTAGVEWQGHDFSFRGMAGVHAAALSGLGHALSFTGSDNLNVLPTADDYYGPAEGLVIGSVPATEHSVATAFGPADERGYFKRLLAANPTGLVSAVSDSYDLWEVLTDVLPDLKDDIMARDGKLVIRPDSGDPVDILTGSYKLRDKEMGNAQNNQRQYEYHRKNREDQNGPLTAAEKGTVELLWETFGGTVNEQGYKVLDPHIGVIYGDSITYDRAQAIMARLEAKGFASTNVVFGVGSFTYQYQTRDTFKSAMKATWVQVNGEGIDIYKDPATDDGTKKSARGKVAVQYVDGHYALFDSTTTPTGAEVQDQYNELQTVWKDGKFVKTYTFAEVRARLGHIK